MKKLLQQFVAGMLIGLIPASAMAIAGYLNFAHSPQASVAFMDSTYVHQLDVNYNLDMAVQTSLPLDTFVQPKKQKNEEKVLIASGKINQNKSLNTTVVGTLATEVSTIKPVEENTPVVPANAQIEAIIEKHAAYYGVDAGIMKSIAYCESTYNPHAINGPYAGLFQFISGTWVSNRKAMGVDPNPALRTNAEEAAKTAAFKMSRDGFGAWPACSKKALASIN